MIKLNYNFHTGMEVKIDKNLSWQVNERGVGGLYRVVDYQSCAEYIRLRRVSDQQEIMVERRTLAYLAGEVVKNPDPYVPLDPDEFLPEFGDIFASEEESEDAQIGFFYCGLIGLTTPTPFINSSLVGSTWCYYTPHPYPW